MFHRFRSGVLSALIILAGLGFLIVLVVAPVVAFVALWLMAEIRASRHRRRSDFLAFELDPFDAARLATSREAAADIVQRLSDIESGRIHSSVSETEAEQLVEKYRLLRTQMAALRELPIRRLRKWSSARAMASACRIGVLCIPALGALIMVLLSKGSNLLADDPYRILSLASAGWIVLGLPMVFLVRRRQIERALGDREMFLERWRPEDDFLDFYLARTERSDREAESPSEGPEEAVSPKDSLFEAERPKRPWYVVLGVEPDAGDDVIRRAYRQRMLEYHPDRTAGLGAELRALAEVVTREITAAYEEAGRNR